MSPLHQAMLKGLIGLSIFAVATAGVIAVTQVATEERIEEQRHRAQSRALLEVVPHHLFNNDLLTAEVTLPGDSGSVDTGAVGYRATLNGETTAIILPAVATEGYTGPIRLIVGIDTRGNILGVRVVEHKETPGLGDKIELRKSDWVIDFNGKSLNKPTPSQWKVVKDGGAFDQFAGATVTPRAVVAAVADTLKYFDNHKAELLKPAPAVSQITLPKEP